MVSLGVSRRSSDSPASFWLTTVLAVCANATPILPGSKLLKFGDLTFEKVEANVASLFSIGSQPAKATSRCKVYPDDPAWPSEEAWTKLNELTDNRLLVKPQPQASVCYDGPYYDGAKCAELTAKWSSSYIHFPDPLEMMSPTAQGMTCVPPTVFNTHTCTRGGFPMYVINATTPEHVQLGVNFARSTGVRLVVKNTGHDFLGKSGGADSLSIWTHHFKDIDYIEKYEDSDIGYSGPAFKAGVGVQAFEIYKAAYEKGRTVVGGEGEVSYYVETKIY
jgi:hypothetical protein